MQTRFVRTAMLTGTMLWILQSSALAQEVPTVEIAPDATLEAHVLIFVPVTYSCPADTVLLNILVDVIQARGRRIATGNGGVFNTPSQPDPDLICDGTPHTVDIGVVLSEDSATTFRNGSAVAEASITACPPSFECLTGLDGPVVIRLH
ncbi:hypothetical protein WMF37_39765 [Sorangium sp. So ce291]|uniref:hypothetical protein n=1 Tax=Sorangium sp. So ce291 TaxID=3133294 RepID=UPI003F5D6B40